MHARLDASSLRQAGNLPRGDGGNAEAALIRGIVWAEQDSAREPRINSRMFVMKIDPAQVRTSLPIGRGSGEACAEIRGPGEAARAHSGAAGSRF